MDASSARRRPSLRVLLVAAVAILTFAAVPAIANAANHGDIDQCANGDPTPAPCGTTGSDAKWQNGDLNANNSTYAEGDSVPFRIKYFGLVVGETVTVTIRYDDMKGGKHAYDFLTSWDASESGDPCGFNGAPAFCPPLSDTFAIPLDPEVSAAFQTAVASRNFSCYGCDITSVSVPSSGAGFPTNEETTIVVTFTVLASSLDPNDGASPLLLWGGHLAKGADWGAGLGAGSITGGPFHMAMAAVTCSTTDCSTGEQDRNIQPGAIEPPLAVAAHSFRAVRSGKAVTLRWRTASEADTLGFVVYRKNAQGKLVRLSKRMIPAASLSGSSASHAYSFRARLASRRLAASSRFVLAEVHLDGSRTLYGPVRASAAS
jgi:hypothetical protein